MSDNNRTNNTVLTAALVAILCGAEVAVITSDMANGARYGLGAVILVALLASVFQLSRARRSR
ncbi:MULTISPECIES: hypothetical protein [unclassified Streptomyces]|uniref:hypothetical protein n=1 Tax=unclassified Streptomyces TaxID=2593676 RepID=UPI002440F5CD|nr:hypothetical protein [Streptomyces sp. DH41]MDG9726524.1 hypothetical protein [Streptomyces sp. DH41]